MNNKTAEWYRRNTDLTIEEAQRLNTFRDWDVSRIANLLRIIKNFSEISCRIFHKRKNGKIIAIPKPNTTKT